MSVFKNKKVVNSLKKKGFTIPPGNHHHVYHEFWHKGKLVTSTYTSHGKGDINDYLIGQMSKQCLLSKVEFKELINCPLTIEKYLKLLKDRGALD